MTTIYAQVSYKLFEERRTKLFSICVPASMEMGRRISAMSCIARKNLIPNCARSFTLIFRLDWSRKPLTIWQSMQDWLYQKTQIGTQHTCHHWVPVVPPPPRPPAPPVNRRTVRGSAVS